MRFKYKYVALCLALLFMTFFCGFFNIEKSYAFNSCSIEKLSVRASFSTNYSTSIKERKNNISLAVKSLDKTLVMPNAEFSFNKVVGARTEKRGYQKSTIILDGKFVEGVGGGVCQVSTTMYNAVLLAGLKVSEYHPHSLSVSYVKPSFDAMVNSTTSDLKFINTTKYPIIIRATADGDTLTIVIKGEKQKEEYYLESVITGYIDPPEPEVIIDEDLQHKELRYGEQKYITREKKGTKSQGYIIKKINGKIVSKKLIRKDSYLPTKATIIEGRYIEDKQEIEETETPKNIILEIIKKISKNIIKIKENKV